MKVLLYAVFKERGAYSAAPTIASHKMSKSKTPWGRALKAEQCSPDEDHDKRDHRLAGDSRSESRATDAEKRRARRSHPALSHKRPGEP
jgi:hypothetical protein